MLIKDETGDRALMESANSVGRSGKVSVLFFMAAIFVSDLLYAAQFTFENLMTYHRNDITRIESLGRWEYEGDAGFYRVIYVDYLLGCSWLYVQWMQVDPMNGSKSPVALFSVYLDDHHENLFEYPEIVENEKGLLLRYYPVSGHEDNVKHEVVLHISNKPGATQSESSRLN